MHESGKEKRRQNYVEHDDAKTAAGGGSLLINQSGMTVVSEETGWIDAEM